MSTAFMRYITDKNGNILDYKISSMLDKWRANTKTCMRIPMPKDFANECVFFHIDVDYIEALAYDDENMDFEIFTRHPREKQQILQQIDEKQQQWCDKFTILAKLIKKHSNIEITFKIACNISIFAFEKYPIEIKFDRKYLNQSWVVSHKKAACIACGIYPNNPTYYLNDMTDELFEQHDKNEKHRQALRQLEWI